MKLLDSKQGERRHQGRSRWLFRAGRCAGLGRTVAKPWFRGCAFAPCSELPGSWRKEDRSNAWQWWLACLSPQGSQWRAPDGGRRAQESYRRRAGPAGFWGCDSRSAEGPTWAQCPGMPRTSRSTREQTLGAVVDAGRCSSR